MVGRTSPHIPLTICHSFSFWILRDASSLDTPSVSIDGQPVMRGPHWNQSLTEDGGDGQIGLIKGTPSAGVVSVLWPNKHLGTYKCGSEEMYEVVLIDESLGGHILSKGIRATENDKDLQKPWSSFGIQLMKNGTIGMTAHSGSSVFTSRGHRMIPPRLATHVTIVQDRSRNLIYLDGILDAENQVPSSFLTNDSAIADQVEYESTHPYADSADFYTVVEAPGATAYTITFDPRTKTEANYDFVRFYKDDSHSAYWGAEKYSGGRSGSASNWPGLGGRPALTIPASRFVIFFKSDASNNDWGYKMSVRIERPCVVDLSFPPMEIQNTKPFYIGQTPSYVNNLPSCPQGFNGSISNAALFQRALSPLEVRSLASSPAICTLNSGLRHLDALALLSRALDGMRHSSAALSELVTLPVVRDVLQLVAQGDAIVQAAALRVCTSLLPLCSISLITEAARTVGLIKDNSFLLYLFYRVGSSLNVWMQISQRSYHARFSNDAEMCVILESIKLIRALVLSETWRVPIVSLLESFVTITAPALLTSLRVAISEENRQEKSFPMPQVSTDELNVVLALLGFLGGLPGGIYLGSSAKYYESKDDNCIPELCTVLTPAWPLPRNGHANKEVSEMWKDLEAFGDAYYIVFDSDPSQPILVPRSKIFALDLQLSDDIGVLLSALSGPIVRLLAAIACADCADKRPRHAPMIVESLVVKEFESPHPYPHNSNVFEHVIFPGAKSIIIEFDPRTRTETNCDYIRFYKDGTKKQCYGAEKYSGRDASQNWPGLNHPLLTINNDSFVLHFHSDGSNNDWGYRFTAKAECSVMNDPPQRPPLLHVSIMAYLKLMGVRILSQLIDRFDWSRAASVPLVPQILAPSLVPLSEIVLPSKQSKNLILESLHPYNHNVDDYIPVSVPRTQMLSISFDPLTATESGADFVRLYKDASRTDHWGESKYTGGKDGGNSNWPGLGGRPALIIPANSFVLHFHTDGSVNAWGWKIIITPTGQASITIDAGIFIHQSQSCFFALRESPSSYTDPPSLSMFAVESRPKLADSDTSDEESASSLLTITPPHAQAHLCSPPSWPRLFIASDSEEQFPVYSAPRIDSEIVGYLPHGTRVTASRQVHNWLLLSNVAVRGGDGWVRRRFEATICFMPEEGQARRDSAILRPPLADGLVLLTSDDSIESSAIVGKSNPFGVEDANPAASTQPDPLPTALETFKSYSLPAENLAVNLSLQGVSHIALECVSSLLSHWPASCPLSVDTFGGRKNFVSYVRAVFIREQSRSESHFARSSALTSIKNSMLGVLQHGSNPIQQTELLGALVEVALMQLHACSEQENSKPRVVASVSHLECMHPYDNNMDTYTDVRHPGAKKLKIVFDPRSSSEKGCDYVRIYSDGTKTTTLGLVYSGKVWAGVGDTPALEIPGESCVVHFHSDGSNNDWGYKLTCYGVMEESEVKSPDRRRAESAAIPELSCWILDFLAKERSPLVQEQIYSSHTLATLRRYLDALPPHRCVFVINLLTCMIQEMATASLTPDAIDEIYLLKHIIMRRCNQLIEQAGPNTRPVASLLQRFIQMSVAIDAALDLLKKSKNLGTLPDGMEDDDGLLTDLGWSSTHVGANLQLDEKESTRYGYSRSVTMVGSSGSVPEDTTTTSTCFSSHGFHKTSHTFHVHLKKFRGGASPVIGVTAGDNLTTQSFSVSWSEQNLACNSFPSSRFGPACRQGDVISISVDHSKRALVFYRNRVLVGVAVGDSPDAVVRMPLPLDKPLRLFVTLKTIGDIVHYVDQVTRPIAPMTLARTMTPLKTPNWMIPIHSAVAELKAWSKRELPCSIIDNFLRRQEKASQLIVETIHPYDGKSFSKKIQMLGAKFLVVIFDPRTALSPSHFLLVKGPNVMLKGDGLCGVSPPSDMLSPLADILSLSVGDTVARGPMWDWGDEDGGPGCLGFVQEITAWQGVENTGAVVKWSEIDEARLYRYDPVVGHFDIQIISHCRNSLQPVLVSGDTLHIVIKNRAGDSLTQVSPDVPSEWQGALEFDGSSSFIEVSSTQEASDFTGDFTVESWIRRSPDLSSSGTAMPILCRQIELEGVVTQFSLQLGWPKECGLDVLVLHMSNMTMSSSALHIKGGSIQPGVWTHVSATIMGTESRLYVNGTLVASASSFSGDRLASLGAPLRIATSSGSFFKGHLFDLRIWSVGRSSEVIQAERMSPVDPSLHPTLALSLASSPTVAGDLIADGVSSNPPSHCTAVRWDAAVEPTVLPVGQLFGFRCTVSPNYSLRSILTSASKRHHAKIITAMERSFAETNLKHDLALIAYIDHVARTRKLTLANLSALKWADIEPTSDALVSLPLLSECIEAHSRNGFPAIGRDAQSDVYMTSRHQHPLKRLEEDNGWACDSYSTPEGCKKGCIGFNQTTGWVRYNCSAGCDFDLCEDCCRHYEVSPPPNKRSADLSLDTRYKSIIHLNGLLSQSLPFIDLCNVDASWSIAHLVVSCRGLVLEATKNPLWNQALSSTASPNASPFPISISRNRATKFSRSGQVDHEARYMIFSQVFRHMHTISPTSLRRTDKLYNVTFLGERAHDAGGPYRESFAMMALELQSYSLPLFVRTPNGRVDVGHNREKWLLNSGSTSDLHFDMFSFVGKLMGIAIRTRNYLALNIPSIIWKLLVNDSPTREDLEAVDLHLMQSLDKLRHIHKYGIDANSFGLTFFETFTTISSDGRRVDLVPNGSQREVTFSNREQYCDLVEDYRRHEFDRQAAAVRAGLGSVVPCPVLCLFSWEQLEEMVCGQAMVDIALLKSVTDYSSCAPTDPHVLLFWQAMEEFSNEERSLFLRFVWGRSRLPLTAEAFPQRFKIQSFGKSPPDQYLPVAHTCFFSVELPRYSTLDIMKERLRYAVFNCQSIDGDDTATGVQAAATGWEDS